MHDASQCCAFRSTLRAFAIRFVMCVIRRSCLISRVYLASWRTPDPVTNADIECGE
jgi:hypothetical protein